MLGESLKVDWRLWANGEGSENGRRLCFLQLVDYILVYVFGDLHEERKMWCYVVEPCYNIKYSNSFLIYKFDQ